MRKRTRQARESGTDGNSFLRSSSPFRESKVLAPFGEPIRALLVEPSLAGQETLERIFHDFAVQVEISCKGLDAVQRLTQEHFDFICVFAPLNDMTVEEWFRSLQPRASHRQPHMLVFTAEESQVESFTSHPEFVKVFHEQDMNSVSPHLIHLIGETEEKSLCPRSSPLY